MQPRPRGPGPIPPCIPEVHFYIPEVLGPPCSLSSRGTERRAARRERHGRVPQTRRALCESCEVLVDGGSLPLRLGGGNNTIIS